MRQMIVKTSPVTIWLGVVVMIGGAFPMHPGRLPLNCVLAQETDDDAPASTTRPYRVGDRLEVEWKGTWYKAEILEEKDGSYKIRYDGYSKASDEWVKPTRMRSVATQAPTQAKDAAKNVRAIQTPKVYSGSPRAGKYLVMGYGNLSNPLHLGYFVLRSGRTYRFYTVGGKLIGSGNYRFDAPSKTVNWLSGPFKKNKWGGQFEISREGKTHTIRVNRATIGTNSSD